MPKLRRRNNEQKQNDTLTILPIIEDSIVEPNVKLESKTKKTNLTIFPGGKKKEEIQIDKEQIEALKRWREKELKDYKVNIPDSTVKNLSYMKIAQALIDCDGFVMKAALKLKITYNRINKLIKLNPKLKQIVIDSTEALLDLAENKLKDAVLAGDKTAIIFTLRSKGRHRGWIEDGPIISPDEKPVTFNYNLRLPAGFKVVTEDGVEVYKNENNAADKKIENE